MDSIDITDSNFSLDTPISNVNEVISVASNPNDYTILIYVSIAILASFIGIFVLKYYQSKNSNLNSNSSENDCEGGFCTMNNKQI